MREKELPEGWEEIQLGEITVGVDKVIPENSPSEYFNYIDIASVDNEANKITEPKTLIGSEAPPRARQLVKAGDILFSTVRTYLKNIAFVSDAFDASVASTGFAVIRPVSLIDSKFIFYFTLSDEFLEPLNVLQRGISYPAVKSSIVFEQLVPLPPLAEQKRIVAKLDEAFQHLDTLKAKLAHIPELLKTFRQSVLTQAVTGKLTEEWREGRPFDNNFFQKLEQAHNSKKTPVKYRKKEGLVEEDELFDIPESWRWIPNYKLAEDGSNSIGAGPFGTIFKAKDFRDNGVPIIFLRHVKPGKYNSNKPNFMDPYVWEESHQPYSVFGGELLITKLGDPPGDAAIYPKGIGTAMVTPDVMKMSVNQDFVLTEYLMYFFNSETSKDLLAKVSFGMTRLRIDLTMFKAFKIPLPTIEEQKEIVKKVEALFAAADAMEAHYQKLKAKIDQLPQALLSKAFRGELVPQDPTDEPASVLLEKIQAAKACTAKAPKSKKIKPGKQTEMAL